MYISQFRLPGSQLYGCGIYGKCTIDGSEPGIQACIDCVDRVDEGITGVNMPTSKPKTSLLTTKSIIADEIIKAQVKQNECCDGVDIPSTLVASITTVSSGCDCMFGVTVSLSYDATNEWWSGTDDSCGLEMEFRLRCSFGFWEIDLYCDGLVGGGNDITMDCGPPFRGSTTIEATIGGRCIPCYGTISISISPT